MNGNKVCQEITELQTRLIYAKDFTPHKIAYYEQCIAEHKNNCSACKHVSSSVNFVGVICEPNKKPYVVLYKAEVTKLSKDCFGRYKVGNGYFDSYIESEAEAEAKANLLAKGLSEESPKLLIVREDFVNLIEC